MRRNVSLEEISDGRLYKENDMVKADCHGCKNCSKCCTGMGESIILDPYDVWRLHQGTGKDMQALMEEGYVELHVVDGCILPNLKMNGTSDCCSFLGEDGRCTIHSHRPGICRLFPLGRYYENGDFRYFLQTGECEDKSRTKIRVSKWIDTPDFKENHEYIRNWHYFLNDVEDCIHNRNEEETSKRLNLALLQIFYFTAYSENDDFYSQFQKRMVQFRKENDLTDVR